MAGRLDSWARAGYNGTGPEYPGAPRAYHGVPDYRRREVTHAEAGRLGGLARARGKGRSTIGGTIAANRKATGLAASGAAGRVKRLTIRAKKGAGLPGQAHVPVGKTTAAVRSSSGTISDKGAYLKRLKARVPRK